MGNFVVRKTEKESLKIQRDPKREREREREEGEKTAPIFFTISQGKSEVGEPHILLHLRTQNGRQKHRRGRLS